MAENEIRLYGTVGDFALWGEEHFTAAAICADLEGRKGDLTVRINSGGGLASEGQAIYTALRDYSASKGKVHVVVDAVAMSAASLIAMAGDTRTMRLGSYLLIHDPASFATDGRGTEADHRRVADQLRVVSDAYAELYAERAGITRAEARRIMREETVMDGETAVLMGFATATEAAEAVPAAKFDYRIYAHAPEGLREASNALGAAKGRPAVMAMMAGLPRPKPPKEIGMAEDVKDAAATAAEEEKKAPERKKSDPKEAPAPEREVDPYAPPEMPPEVEAAVRRERERGKEIRMAVAMARLPATMADDFIERGLSPDAARKAVLEHLADAAEKEPPMTGRTTMRVTHDARDRFATGVEKALLMRVGLEGGERNEFSSMRGIELCRAAIAANGRRLPPTATEHDIARMALTMVGEHTTNDFGNLLGNVARKSLIKGWDEEDEQFELVTGRPVSVPDFRPTTLVGLGFFPTLPLKPEGAEYQYGTLGDRTRTIQVVTHGEAFAISREAIINDQLDALLGEAPRKLGQAARRTVANIVWNIFLANSGTGVAYGDGQNLFHSSRGNVAGTPAALSVDSLGAAISAMRVQRGDGSLIGMRAAYLIVPAALEFKAREIVNSTVYPGTNRGMQANPVAGAVKIIVEPRLDAVSTTRWYLIADPNVRDVVKLAYLNGNAQPFMDEEPIWKTDGRAWKVRIDAGAAPGDYQAVYTNAGA